ncbi:hypothetical protein [Maribacter sp. 2308TA10-17]|uniref:hypothetical protein n=1 Tax=Maribacter sp. 2308TA10-17 TaxID=3386276 RepID=UPI0039BC9FB1
MNEGDNYYGLEVCEYGNRIEFYLLQIQRKKQELFIVQEEVFTSINDLVEVIQKGVPLFLVVNTSKVLVKILPPTTDTNQKGLVHNAFPNLDFDSFYYELVRTNKNLIISICRKEHIDKYLKELSELQLPVKHVFIGISPISNSLNYFPSGKLSLSNTDLILNEGVMENTLPHSSDEVVVQKEYQINGLKVKNTYLLVFSGVLGHLLKSFNSDGNLKEVNSYLGNEFKNKRHFKLLLRSSLAFVLGLLFINFLVFNYYFEQVNTLEETLTVNKANKEQLVQLNADVKKKEERLNAVLAMANSNTSEILDELAQSLPVSILLNEIQYQPLQKPLRESKPVVLENKVLKISGKASNSNDFYNWIADLEKFLWIDRVETTDYDYSSKNISDFSIKIISNE